MNKACTILMLSLAASVAAANPVPQTAPEVPLLRDGFILRDVAGTLVRQSAEHAGAAVRAQASRAESRDLPEPPDSNDVWLFELSSDVNDSGPRRPDGSPAASTNSGQTASGPVLKAGTRLELLRSSTLDRMVADVPKISNLKSQISDSPSAAGPTYLLNGRMTKYKGRNFIFPDYFLPLRPEKAKPEVRDSNVPASRWVMALDEPNDAVALPPGFIEKLRARREKETGAADVQINEPRQPAADANAAGAAPYSRNLDSILVDRTGFLIKRPQSGLVFSLDALGRNIERVELRLLPCEALETAEREQTARPEPMRFRIGGIVTTYKGDSYLLPQKAIRTYSHNNFGR